MSLATDSPVHSSSSDDFAEFLDGELASTSDTSPDVEDEDWDVDEDEDVGDMGMYQWVHLFGLKIKRQKVEVPEGVNDCESSTSQLDAEQILVKEDICVHPGFIRGLCMICGQKVDYDDSSVQKYNTSVALKYIHKDLRLGNDEIARVRNRDLTNLLRRKKLYLVLDLDHTLLNSTQLHDIKPDEEYLKSQVDSLQVLNNKDGSRGSLFRLDVIRMLTKLRPFVRTFLKEASYLFEMYIYTMGERRYALEMANLLDPGKEYFISRVIAKDDCTQKHQKGLDVVLGQESAVLILDDTEQVWAKHKENLILVDRYIFFASSCQQFGHKSLSQLKSDGSESDGALASILEVLKQIHSMFFDSEPGANLADRDVRQILPAVTGDRLVRRGTKM